VRLQPETSGRDHSGLTVTEDDHHPVPTSVTIDNTTQVINAGTLWNLDISLPQSNYQAARVIIHGPDQCAGAAWYEFAEIYVTRDSAEAMGHSVEEISFKKVYAVTYSKQVADTYLSQKIFTNASPPNIVLQDAVLTGSLLRLSFRNTYTANETLWVKGQALLF